MASESVAAIVDGTVSNQRLSKAFGRFIGRSFSSNRCRKKYRGRQVEDSPRPSSNCHEVVGHDAPGSEAYRMRRRRPNFHKGDLSRGEHFVHLGSSNAEDLTCFVYAYINTLAEGYSGHIKISTHGAIRRPRRGDCTACELRL